MKYDEGNLYEQVENEFVCEHLDRELRKKTRSNGSFCFRDQCLTCGKDSGDISKSKIHNYPFLPPYDESLKDKWIEKRKEYYNELRSQKSDIWWEWYNEYLQSDEWQDKRTNVFKRSGYICEGCGNKRATEVHHRTYDHVGEEMLFELVALCNLCHSILHPDKE